MKSVKHDRPMVFSQEETNLSVAYLFFFVTCKLTDCLGFYAISTVFQLFNGDSSQIHVSWTNIFNQCLTSQLSWQWQVSRSAIPLILSAKGKATITRFKDWFVEAGDLTHDLPLTRRTL